MFISSIRPDSLGSKSGAGYGSNIPDPTWSKVSDPTGFGSGSTTLAINDRRIKLVLPFPIPNSVGSPFRHYAVEKRCAA